MTTHSLLEERRTLAVFDMETGPDPAAAAAAGYKGTRLRSALLRITTACLLVATEGEDGVWRQFTLRTFTDPLSEFELLMQLDTALSDLPSAATLVTYNGRAHDLAVLRRRCARYWMFGLVGIEAAASMDHLDVMLRQQIGRRDGPPTLREACAGLGISAFDPRRSAGPRLPPQVAKCQVDVVATFLLALFEIAIERGSPDALVAGWAGLSEYLTALRPAPTHLEHFRNHPLLRAGQRERADAL